MRTEGWGWVWFWFLFLVQRLFTSACSWLERWREGYLCHLKGKEVWFYFNFSFLCYLGAALVLTCFACQSWVFATQSPCVSAERGKKLSLWREGWVKEKATLNNQPRVKFGLAPICKRFKNTLGPFSTFALFFFLFSSLPHFQAAQHIGTSFDSYTCWEIWYQFSLMVSGALEMPIRCWKILAPAWEEDVCSNRTNNKEVSILLHPPDTRPNPTNLNPHWRGVSPSAYSKICWFNCCERVVEGTPLMWDGALQSQESVLICLWLLMEPWGSLSEIKSFLYSIRTSS